MSDQRWAYYVTLYYGPDAKPPKKPGAMAIEVGCADQWTAAMEVKASRARKDIGEIVVEPALTGRAAEWAADSTPTAP